MDAEIYVTEFNKAMNMTNVELGDFLFALSTHEVFSERGAAVLSIAAVRLRRAKDPKNAGHVFDSTEPT